MKTSKINYKQMVKNASPPSKKGQNFLVAFLVGGAICALGQVFREIYFYIGLDEQQVMMLVPISLIFLSALLTALQIYDNIAKHAGAGTLVPITGFANAIVSNAMEFRTEGLIFGTGVKIFTIAGPVIVYGTVASVVYGIIYWITAII
ncbi:MAG: stage V sporulation protein AC [Clostridia bacterium]|nr:stage V sporulation protein AC [Clostridia bacterium]